MCLRHVREHHRQTAVILITAYASVETAVEAMKMGAYDYVTKPFKIDELQMTVQRALDYQAALRENVYLRKELKNRYRFENIIGTSRKMQHVYNLINKVADTDSTVLIMGESGTGKELVARGLHFNSNRQHHPFVAINCSALPENLLESELFGHKKGAFTGAVADKRGLFEEANLGTIFLDEVNSMAPPLQTKLLRVLQEREVRRVGRQQELAGERARGRRDERSASAEVEGRHFSRRPLLPPGCDSGGYSAAARAPGRRAVAGEPFPAEARQREPGASRRRSSPRRSIFCVITIIRETCASWRMRSNAPARLCEDDMILPTDLPPQHCERSAGRESGAGHCRHAGGAVARRVYSAAGARLHRSDPQTLRRLARKGGQRARHQHGHALSQGRAEK